MNNELKDKVKCTLLESLISEGDFWHPDPEQDSRYDRTNARKGTSLSKRPSVSNDAPKPSGPVVKDKGYSTLTRHPSNGVVVNNHASPEDAHLHAHLQTMKTGQDHHVVHNGVKVATFSKHESGKIIHQVHM